MLKKYIEASFIVIIAAFLVGTILGDSSYAQTYNTTTTTTSQTTTSPTQTTVSVFGYNTIGSELSLGSSGSNVTNLQTFLASNSKVYPERLITGYFGPLTQTAVTQFQIGYGIPAVGRVGPLTLQKINSLILAGEAIDVSAPLISNVSASNITSQGASISLNATEPSSIKVFYDRNPLIMTETSSAKTAPFISGSVAQDLGLSTSKTISLTGLATSSSYYYVVQITDRSGNVSVTLPRTLNTNP